MNEKKMLFVIQGVQFCLLEGQCSLPIIKVVEKWSKNNRRNILGEAFFVLGKLMARKAIIEINCQKHVSDLRRGVV